MREGEFARPAGDRRDGVLTAAPAAERLDVTVASRSLVSLIHEAAAKHVRTPRMLVLEVLEKVFAPGDLSLVSAILDD